MNNVSAKTQFATRAAKRLVITVSGVVQGVGFRPFVYHLAQRLNIKGWVCNTGTGVEIDAEGPGNAIEEFLSSLQKDLPSNSFIQDMKSIDCKPLGYAQFEIVESNLAQLKTALLLPDIAMCAECLDDVFNSSNRRYLYPFTNCTHCGPRYSIITTLPYDRVNTSMDQFTMCDDCRNEYENPKDRRFHAQPNACPACGPHLELWDQNGKKLFREQEAIVHTINAFKNGSIVAVKGLGGFHIFVDAFKGKSVELLRKRKKRLRKPLAVMFPSIELIEKHCVVSDKEKEILQSGASPIVIVRKKPPSMIAASVAPDNPNLGVFLPHTPLHHILMRELAKPMVATSGNMSEEPICIEENDARRRLKGIVDFFLIHNRPIVRPVDDSIVRVIADCPQILRQARGYAPQSVSVEHIHQPVFAVGAHLKNTIALGFDGNVTVSQHLGDLQTAQSLQVFKGTIDSFKKIFEQNIKTVACDFHPDYLSTQWAVHSQKKVERIQHHHAHVVACMAENNLSGTVLGIVWDGTGFGSDATIWGGEFLKANLKDFQRMGHFKTFMLPGGDRAVAEPRRSALGLLKELSAKLFLDYADMPVIQSFSFREQKVLNQMLNKNINSPRTSSVGRLFDAVAALLDLCQVSSFEGEAAMALEYEAESVYSDNFYHLKVKEREDGSFEVDWVMMVNELITDIRAGCRKNIIAAKFHIALIEIAVTIARRINEAKIVLSGGCFQNKILTERMIDRLKKEGFEVYWHQRIPPNDGGIALGQAVCAAARQKS